MMMGLAEIVIILAVVIALLMFFGMWGGAKSKRVVARPALIDDEALNDAELQSYLPNQKIEAIKRYRELTDVGLKEAKDVIDWVIYNGAFSGHVLEKPKFGQMDGGFDWDALQDDELQSYLPDNKINAIKRYRELTDLGLKEAKDAIDYIVANPDAIHKSKSAASRLVDTEGAGIRDLIAEGRFDEATDVYAAFMGVDLFSARNAIRAMAHEMGLDDESGQQAR